MTTGPNEMLVRHVSERTGRVSGGTGLRRARAAHYFEAAGPAQLGTGVGRVSPPAATRWGPPPPRKAPTRLLRSPRRATKYVP
jgi:hypothetical protein